MTTPKDVREKKRLDFNQYVQLPGWSYGGRGSGKDVIFACLFFCCCELLFVHKHRMSSTSFSNVILYILQKLLPFERVSRN